MSTSNYKSFHFFRVESVIHWPNLNEILEKGILKFRHYKAYNRRNITYVIMASSWKKDKFHFVFSCVIHTTPLIILLGLSNADEYVVFTVKYQDFAFVRT